MLSADERAAYGNAFITLLPCDGQGPRVGVKDLIDIAHVVTTAGCRYLAEHCPPPGEDAACLEGIRAAGASIVGKTNLHELAFGTTGLNSWSGTPVNPLGADLLPGGSSSGSAVALARRFCDLALGTDTGGSVRIPSACCGTAGLKTTYGRIPLRGVRPLAPSLDIVGPMARDIAGLVRGMQLLEPGFTVSARPAGRVGRLRAGEADPRVDAAADRALAASGLQVDDCDITEQEWEAAVTALNDILWAEAAEANLDIRAHWGELQNGANLVTALRLGKDRERMAAARETRRAWERRLAAAVGSFGLLASPAIETLTPSFREYQSRKIRMSRFTSPVNLAGFPAVVFPVPADGPLPSSLQLIGPPGSEDLLLATAAVIERSVAGGRRGQKG
jgi:amidase